MATIELVAAADLRALLADQLVERGDPRLDERDLRAVRRVLSSSPSWVRAVAFAAFICPISSEQPADADLRVEHLLLDAIGGQLALDLSDALLGVVDLVPGGLEGVSARAFVELVDQLLAVAQQRARQPMGVLRPIRLDAQARSPRCRLSVSTVTK